MIQIIYNPASFEDFKNAVELLKSTQVNGATVAPPRQSTKLEKGPKELEYQKVFGKNLRLNAQDLASGKDRETVAAERLDKGVAGETEPLENLQRDADVNEDSPY
jgi:hypothetical protein